MGSPQAAASALRASRMTLNAHITRPARQVSTVECKSVYPVSYSGCCAEKRAEQEVRIIGLIRSPVHPPRVQVTRRTRASPPQSELAIHIPSILPPSFISLYGMSVIHITEMLINGIQEETYRPPATFTHMLPVNSLRLGDQTVHDGELESLASWLARLRIDPARPGSSSSQGTQTRESSLIDPRTIRRPLFWTVPWVSRLYTTRASSKYR